MAEHKKLTIILPLYNRCLYTKRWFDANLDPDFDYIVCDGGVEGYDEAIIKSFACAHITYMRFPPDCTGSDFLRKIVMSLASVRTTYVMLVDNDDFLHLGNIKKMIQVLDRNPSFKGINGLIGQFSEVDSRYTKAVVGSGISAERLSSVMGIHAVDLCLNDYTYFYYGITRTSVQYDIYSDLLNSGCNNLYQSEIFQTLLLLSRGKVLWYPQVFYLRQRNPMSSSAQSDLSKGPSSSMFDFVLNKSYEASFDNLCNRVAMLCGVDSEVIYNKVRIFLIKSHFCQKPVPESGLRSLLFRNLRKSTTLKKLLRALRFKSTYKYDLLTFKTLFLLR